MRRSGIPSAIEKSLSPHLREQGWVRPGIKIGVAVSGGADSVALLHLLLDLQPALGLVLSVVHMNHMLRGRASDGDEKFVASLAKKLKVPLHARRENVAQRAQREKRNVEETGRRARYEFFDQLVRQGIVDRVATAHTMDDQAETVLAHILRGTGLPGLGGIHPDTNGVIRPLLLTRRAELRKYLRSRRLVWREDKTNQDPKRTRARIRLVLMPLLERKFQAAVVEHLSQLSELAREDEAFLYSEAMLRLDTLARETPHGIRISIAGLRQAHKPLELSPPIAASLLQEISKNTAISKRVVREIVKRVKPRAGQLSASHVGAVLDFALSADNGSALQLPGGVEVRRDRDVLHFVAMAAHPHKHRGASRLPRIPAGYAYELDFAKGSARVQLEELSCRLHFRDIDWPPEGRETTGTGVVLDRGRLRPPILLRNWHAGDSMQPKGHRQAHSLARLLNEISVSRWDKAVWPVLTSGGKVAWTRGLAAADEFAAGPGTRRALVIAEEPTT